MAVDLKKDLQIDDTRYRVIISVKEDYLDGRITLEEGNRLLKEKIGTCTPDEFAFAEQRLKGAYADEEVRERMDDLLALFDGVLQRFDTKSFPENHPLWVYEEELSAMDKVIAEARALLAAPSFIKNPWLGVYDSLTQWRIHLSRKQNQLYPVLETHGFDRPTRIMWTFDDEVRDTISAANALLREDKHEEFIAMQTDVLEKLSDLMNKEREVLLPTSFKMLDEEEFVTMSRGDHEIGFALIPAPPYYHSEKATKPKVEAQASAIGADFLQDLAALLGKYTGTASNVVDKDTELDVATGKLSLERINLLFKHMPVDLSYVDENELVKFYSDTKHRIFPRSANVIGREVKNCHPAKSITVVEEIIRKFRTGEQSKAEFWINKPGVFIYVLYTAVRDDEGNFKGVLEMMQDCTHIRALEGSRTLLTWDGDTFVGDEAPANEAENEAPRCETPKENKRPDIEEPEEQVDADGGLIINEKTTIGQVAKRYPEIVDFMISLNPVYEKLKTPMAKFMMKIATLKMVSERGNMDTDELVAKIKEFTESLGKR